jgi:hypothetical protein
MLPDEHSHYWYMFRKKDGKKEKRPFDFNRLIVIIILVLAILALIGWLK